MKNPPSFWRVTRYTLGAVVALALFILLKPTLPASHAQPQPQPTPIAFETPVAYTTGRAPLALTAGDFNGDSRLDLATVNAGDRTVSLLLNQGNGAFGAKSDFPTGADPVRLVAGDFNNDNKLDLVTTNFSANSFSLLLGNGNGTFAPKTDTATAAGPFAVAAGDFNRDNRLDLIVGYASQILNFVSYYPGNGNGSFGTRVDLTAGRFQEELAVADFNADNNPDIAVANINDRSISILLGNGNGTFAAKRDTALTFNPAGLDVADNNGDGRLDLLISSFFENRLRILPGNGNGTFGTPVELIIPPPPAANLDAQNQASARLRLGVPNSPPVQGKNFKCAMPPTATVAAPTTDGDGLFTIAPDDDPRGPDILVKNELHLAFLQWQSQFNYAGPQYIQQGTAQGTKNDYFFLFDVDGDGSCDTVSNDITNNQIFVSRQRRPCPLIIFIGTPPVARFDKRYDFTFAIQGGEAPYRTEITGGDLPQGLSLRNLTISGTPEDGGDFSFMITVTDKNGCKGSQIFTIEVTCPPISITGTPPTALVGKGYEFVATIEGDNIADVELRDGGLPPGLFYRGSGQTVRIFGTPTTAGDYKIFLLVKIARENPNLAERCLVLLGLTLKVVNCPQITVSPNNPHNATHSAPYSLVFSAAGGQAPYSFSVETVSGFSINAQTGELSGTPGLTGSIVVRVTAKDALGCTGLLVHTIPVSLSPTFDSILSSQLPASTLGQSYMQNFPINGGTPPLKYNATPGSGQLQNGDARMRSQSTAERALIDGLPPGITLNATTGVLSGTPTAPGTYNFTVTATDFNGASVSRAFSLVVACPAVTLSPTTLPGGQVGAAYTQTLTATGGGTPSFALSAGALPPGLTLNTATGALSGTPTQAGTFTFTIRATDNSGCSGTREYTLTIACPTVTLSPNTLPGGQVGAAYTQTLTATGGGAPSFALSTGALPPGLTLNTATGALSGTPTQAGTFTFTIRATDSSGCSGTREYTLTIACPTVTLSPNTLPEGRTGTAYQQTLTASGAGGGTLSFAVSAGVLPPGLTLTTTTGALSGTPIQTGTFTFTIRASTTGGCSGTREYTLTIACPTVTLNPNTLPAATVGATYNRSLAPSGGTAPYTFSLTEGALPAGLSLSAAGLLTGTPTRPGDFNFSVKATDASGCNVTRAYTLNIACPAVTLTPNTLPDGRTGTAYQQTFTISAAGLGTLSFTVSAGALPPGLTLNAATGTLSGTPTQAGTFSFTVRATASSGCNGTREYTLTILCPTLTLNPDALPNGTLGAAYNQLLATSGGTAPYSFSLSAGTLPTGLTFSAAGALSGTPTQLGAFNFTVRSVDASGCAATRVYTLTIACPTVTLGPNTLPEGRVGRAYQQTLTATGGGTLNFTISAGALPPGLNLASTTGVLAGTPSGAGTFNFTIRATSSTTCSGTQVYTLVIAALPAVASVSAASFRAESVAPEMIVAAFGAGFSTTTQVATTQPLPTALAGTTVRITDSAGAERLAQLFFVSPQQINYLLPAGLSRGRAVVAVLNGNELVAAGTVQINDVAPGLFSANASGQGVPAAIAIKLLANGEQVFLPVAQFDAQLNRFVPVPLEVGAAGERVFVVLFGTGLRQRSALDKVTAKLGGVDAPVFFAGAQGQLDGLDQVNLEISNSLAGRGLVDVLLSVDGQNANTVQLQFK
jgi:uncharacterized protein (TIGR03437 family)